MGTVGAARGLLQNHEQQCLQTLQRPIYRRPVLGLQLGGFGDGQSRSDTTLPATGPASPGRGPYLALQGAQQPPFLAEGLEEVEQVKVGQLPIEPLHGHVKASDHIAAQLQGHSCLDGPGPALQRG